MSGGGGGRPNLMLAPGSGYKSQSQSKSLREPERDPEREPEREPDLSLSLTIQCYCTLWGHLNL